MKNKIGTIRNAVDKGVKAIIPETKKASRIDDLRYFGFALSRDLPFLSKKPWSFTNFTLWASFVQNGTNIIVKNGKAIEYLPRIMPMLIRVANIRFQKLSRFKQDWINRFFTKAFMLIFSTALLYFQSLILPRISKFAKIISTVSLLFIFASLTSIARANDYVAIIDSKEREYDIPSGLLAAIAKVESSNKAFALNVGGRPIYARSLDQAVAITQKQISSGRNNIDVGIMQLNYRWHGKAFANLEEMLNPEKNIDYAARLLCSLYKKHGKWHSAVRHYHSAKDKHNMRYSRRVAKIWLASN